MAKRNAENSQISINFAKSYARDSASGQFSSPSRNCSPSSVTNFVDRRTSVAREEALSRVKASGIFDLSKK